MYAPRHLVFAGPGALPEELRLVISRRTGSPQAEVPQAAPRLLGIFDNASEAERVSAGLQRLKIGAAVAGPEQPPVEEGWAVARSLELFAEKWRATTSAGVAIPLDLASLAAIAVVEWRPAEKPVDRGVLLRFRDGSRPAFLRARAIDQVSERASPGRGLQALAQLLDACAAEMPQDTRVRQRRLSPEDWDEAALGIDLLPLAVAVVDQLDETHSPLSQPLSGEPSTPHAVASRRSALPREIPRGAGALAWGLYATSLALGPVCLGLLMVGAMMGSFNAMISGVLAGAVGSRRLGWAQWLGRQRWGEDSHLPRWPRQDTHPAYADLLLDASLLASTIYGAFDGSIVQAVLLFPVAAVFGLSAAAVWMHALLSED